MTTKSPKETFSVSWETKFPITLPIDKIDYTFILKYSYFYNCYQTKGFFEFTTTDCASVVDRLIIQTKTAEKEEYKTQKEFELKQINKTNRWIDQKIIINNINSVDFYVCIVNYKIVFTKICDIIVGR